MRSGGCAPFSVRASSRIQEQRPSFAPIPLPCLSTAQALGTRAEARGNLPAICSRRRKAGSDPICRIREFQRALQCPRHTLAQSPQRAQRTTTDVIVVTVVLSVRGL